MLLLLFLKLIESKYPIVLIPGSFRSRLHVTSDRRAGWYCPKHANNTFVFISVKYFIPPFLSCFLDWMTVDYNETTNSQQNREGVDIHPEDFGGISDVTVTGPRSLSFLFSYMLKMVKKFEGYGYVPKKDLFAAPYDWRFGADMPDSYYESLQRIVEQAYTMNNNTKVALIAHSLGSQLAHIFLTEKTTPEWRKKYINSTTLIAPSWSGSGVSFNTLMRLQSSFLSIFVPNKVIDFACRLGTLHIHMPHSLAYENTTLFIDPDGNEYKAPQLVDFLVKNKKLTPEQLKLGEKNYFYTRRYPKPLDVPTNILFNSGMKTALGMKLKGWKRFGSAITQKGDGLVGSAVVEWAIKNWKMNETLRYHDMNSSYSKFKHKNLLSAPECLEIVTAWLNLNETTEVKGEGIISEL